MTVEPFVSNHPKCKGRLQEEGAYYNQTTGKQTLRQGGLNSFPFYRELIACAFYMGEARKDISCPSHPW